MYISIYSFRLLYIPILNLNFEEKFKPFGLAKSLKLFLLANVYMLEQMITAEEIKFHFPFGCYE